MVDPERILRQQSIYLVKSVWGLSDDVIEARLKVIGDNIRNPRAKERLDTSHRLLVRTIEQIGSDIAYEREEDPQTFKELLWSLKDMFVALFDSNIIEEAATVDTDRIDYLSIDFYKRMSIALNLDENGQLNAGYAGITGLIRMLRNCTEHAEPPRDLITGKFSFGNIHTLASIAVLSIYAYHEIVGIWCDVIIYERGE